jgi:hypothetical protein
MSIHAWRPRVAAAVRLSILSTLTLVFVSPVALAPLAGTRPAGEMTAYLPVVVITPTLAGRITDHGLGAAEVPLTVVFFDGNSRSTIRTFETDANGDYSFSDLPPLVQGQFYTVDYVNSTDPSRVSSWETRDVYPSDGSNASFGTVDLADTPLLSPSDGMVVSLPVTFQWTGRPWSPNDRYLFNIHDAQGPPAFDHGGTEDHYLMSSLPTGFEFGHWYVWRIYILNYDTRLSFGISYHERMVQFSN